MSRLHFLGNIQSQENICKGLTPFRTLDENENYPNTQPKRPNDDEGQVDHNSREIDQILDPYPELVRYNILKLYFVWHDQ